MKGTLYLVNRAHPLPEEPSAEVLASVRSGQTEVRLHQRAKVMLDQLLAAVGSVGAIVPVSGYRPQTEQQAIWEDALAEHGKAFTETYVARPGCSEHQTGLAIDLGENRPEVDFLCPAFPDSGPAGRCAAGPPTLALSSATPRGRRMLPASDTSRGTSGTWAGPTPS